MHSIKTEKPCECISNGTVIAIADRETPDVNRFNILGDDLACQLIINFSSIFCNKNVLKREHSTVWRTLRYFDENDFEAGKKY